MTRPRVIHVYKDVYPPVEGGVERTIYHMARLARESFDPAIVIASRERAPTRRRISGDIEVIEVPSFGRFLSTPIAPAFVTVLRRIGADLFHFHLPHPTGELAFLLSRVRTPAVATYHSDIVRQKITGAVYRPLLRRFLGRMHTIMPTSRRYLETSTTLAPHRDRCRVVPLGLPIEEYDPSARIRTRAEEFIERWGDFVFFLGCLRYYKGLHFLIEAMTKLPGVNLVIAGKGPEGENLKRLARERGIDDRVHFMGWVDQPAALALLRGAALFCLPAHERAEAFGLCQIEAMACGLPVVSTDLPTGVPEVNRHEETGLIVPPGDPDALGTAIRRLLDDPALRERLGRGGRSRVAELYTARRMMDQVSEVYREALGMSVGPPDRSR